jgi:TRAP-type C4-dicarboxylate transport system substrate-binding protein
MMAFEVARYYSEDGHVRTPEVILFSKKTWERLAEEDRELIRRAAKRSIPYQRKLWDEKVEEAVQKAVESGCEIITDVDTEAFREAMQPVYEKHAREYTDLIERIRQAAP